MTVEEAYEYLRINDLTDGSPTQAMMHAQKVFNNHIRLEEFVASRIVFKDAFRRAVKEVISD